MVGLNFKDFPDLEKGDFVLGKSKQNIRIQISTLLNFNTLRNC